MSIFEEVNGLVNDKINLLMYFVMKSDDGDSLEIKAANIEDGDSSDENTTEELLNAYRTLITNDFSNLTGDSLVKLSSADDRLNAVYQYDLDEKPEIFSIMEDALKMSVPGSREPVYFNFKEDDMKLIQGIIIVLGNSVKQVVFYKQSYPISLLRRDKITLVQHKSRFKRLDKDVLRVDINYHFMYFEKKFYIFDLKQMEKLTGYDGIIKKEAIKSIIEIQNMELLEDVQPLKDDLDDVTFARKLTKVHKDSKVIGKIDNDIIINFISKHSYFKKHPIKVNEKKSKLIIDTKISKKALISLLNDDLLQSELTEQQYHSRAKDDV